MLATRGAVVVVALALVGSSAACSDGKQASSGSSGGSTGTGASGTTSSTGTGAGSTGGSQNGYFPSDSWMYQDVSSAPLHSESAAMTQWLQDNGGWGTGEMRIDFSIEVLDATSDTPMVSFEPNGDFFSPDCDQVDVPLPADGNLEGEDGYECTTDGDCHLIVVDAQQQRLFEMWRADIVGNSFSGGCLAAWDMTRTYGPEGRGEQCTSADAAGFPIAPLLFSADEVAAGVIDHAIRFILPNARMRGGFYTRPGTHAGGPNGPAPAPVYGGLWRLKASFDVESLPSEGAKVVARALQTYGMALADGGNIALTAQSDRHTSAKWEGLLNTFDLTGIQPSDFDVVDTGPDIELTFDCVRTPY
jgi:hypothetical protein